MKTIKSRIIRTGLAAAAMGLAGAAVEARSIAVDFDGSGFDGNGENFALSDSHFGANATGAVPFALNFGTGAASYDFCFNPNGFVSFVASGAGCAFSAAPSGDYVAVFSTALTTGGNTLWSTGLIDTAAPYVAADTVPAMRFIWDATDGSANSILTELMLIDRGGGSFDLDLRYGSTLFGIGRAGDGPAGIEPRLQCRRARQWSVRNGDGLRLQLRQWRLRDLRRHAAADHGCGTFDLVAVGARLRSCDARHHSPSSRGHASALTFDPAFALALRAPR